VDDSLTCMTEACPLIEHLILSSCLSIGIDGLSSLHCLHKLTLLDLSYTFLINLKPIFDSCPQLKVSLTVFVFGTLMLQILEYGTLRWNLILTVVILCKYIMQPNVYSCVDVCNAIKVPLVHIFVTKWVTDNVKSCLFNSNRNQIPH
jgi:hypothetical protein